MSQLTYGQYHEAGYAGMKADTGFDFCETLVTSGITTPGMGVVRVGNTARLPITTDTVIEGVLVHDHATVQKKLPDDGTVFVDDKTPSGIMRRGQIYVATETAVNVNDAVYCRIKTNAAKVPGWFGNASVATETVLVPSARFVESKVAGYAKIEINLP